MRSERFEFPNGKGEKLAATLDRRSGCQKGGCTKCRI